jgi:NTE family protein
LEKYAATYPNASVLLFEPKQSDAAIFLTSIFSLKNRRKICQLAYAQTRADLLERQTYYAPLLAQHGLKLRLGVLTAKATAIVGEQPRQRPRKSVSMDAAAKRLNHALQDLERKLWVEKIA